MRSATGSFPAETASVGEARRFVRASLAEWGAGDWEWAATQVVSELATNAVLHARSEYLVEVCFDGREVRLRVEDASPRSLQTRRFSDGSTTGRGLALVAALATEWGVETAAGGKSVWCALRPADEQAPPDPAGRAHAATAAAARHVVERATPARHDPRALARAA